MPRRTRQIKGEKPIGDYACAYDYDGIDYEESIGGMGWKKRAMNDHENAYEYANANDQIESRGTIDDHGVSRAP